MSSLIIFCRDKHKTFFSIILIVGEDCNKGYSSEVYVGFEQQRRYLTEESIIHGLCLCEA